VRAEALVPGEAPPRPDRAGAAAGKDPFDAALEEARRDPGNVESLLALAAAGAARGGDGAGAPRRVELGHVAEALAAFLDPGLPAPPPPPLLVRIPPQARARVALPLAAGSMPQLLALLAPWLESLFPADVARRGGTAANRIGPGRAPGLDARVAVAMRALGSRPVVAFLPDEGGWDVGLENTQPPSLVIGPRLARELRESAVDFALARALCLVDGCYALLGKFAPRDVGILCELACRFAGGAPPSLGLPPERAQAFLEALGRLVPAAVVPQAAALAADASADLRALDPRGLQLAVRRTASRQALLWSGDPLGALEALAVSRRRPDAPDPLADRARALADPDLSDLAAFALSDLGAGVRASLAGDE